MGLCKAMVSGKIINTKSMWAIGKIIERTVTEFMLLIKATIKVYFILN